MLARPDARLVRYTLANRLLVLCQSLTIQEQPLMFSSKRAAFASV